MSRWSTFTRFLFIILLIAGLGTFVYYRVVVSNKNHSAALVDRVPVGDFMIKTNLLEVAKETSGLLFANKIKFRDFFSHEFILGQGKNFGLDLQSTSYIFANKDGEWGGLIAVKDSSKIFEGINMLRQNIAVRDTTVQSRKVFYWPEENGFVGYDKDWLFIYKGDHFTEHLDHVANAKKGDIEPVWAEFVERKELSKQNLVIQANLSQLTDLGIETAIFAHDSDSSSFTVLTYFKSKDDWNFSRKSSGKSLQYNAYTNRYMNLHMDVNQFRKSKKDPFYKLLSKLSKRISFPLNDFLNAWEGDLSFVQGGFQKITETYIETEMDDDFNLQEIQKSREVKVSGFSLALSMNKKAKTFFEKLKTKGILTENDGKFRLLFSPPLNYSVQGKYHLFHSADYAPLLSDDNLNNGLWNEQGTKFNFQLDSLNSNEAFGKLKFPVDKLIQGNKFF